MRNILSLEFLYVFTGFGSKAKTKDIRTFPNEFGDAIWQQLYTLYGHTWPTPVFAGSTHLEPLPIEEKQKKKHARFER